MRKILVVSANRAESGLLAPILYELKKRHDVKAEFCDLILDEPPNKHSIKHIIFRLQLFLSAFNPQIILIPTDRWEMVYVAAYTFHLGYVNCHFHAGDAGSGITDEMNRYAISFLSHILLCNSEESRGNLLKIGFEPERIFVVGTTALDGIKLVKPKIGQPYDLILLHPDPISEEATESDLEETIRISRVFDATREHFIVWLRPNKDQNYEIIDNFLNKRVGDIPRILVLDNISRPEFLGLLKNSARYIGNSSAFSLEAPLISPKGRLIKVGFRNKNRTPPSVQIGASKRIAEILATIPINDRLKRKILRY